MRKISLNICLVLLWFSQSVSGQNDLVIVEVMADPAPSMGLPANEWIEVKNVSSLPVNIHQYRIGDANGVSGILPFLIIEPDSLLIICATSAVATMSTFGRTAGVSSFPAIDNDGDLLFIRDRNGRTMHAIRFQKDWYGNSVKGEGGWTLEMIDEDYPCAGSSNWIASKHAPGGTPGKINSQAGINPDLKSPVIKNVFMSARDQVELVFDETLDSAASVIRTNFTVDGGPSVTSAVGIAPLFERVRLHLSLALDSSRIYELRISDLRDCANNVLDEKKIRIGIPSAATRHDIIVNELMFNPQPGGYDYLELFNRSEKIIDLSQLYISSLDRWGSVVSTTSVSTEPLYAFPGEYLAFTYDPADLKFRYHVKDEGSVIRHVELPSFPDDEGRILLHGSEDIDRFDYNEKMHFPLVSDREGVALERIDYRDTSNKAYNWHSASSSSGYGTPGYINSQHFGGESANQRIEILPPVFSPDSDGYDDFVLINYQLDEPGFTARVLIFDGGGNQVRILVNNELLGKSGTWKWDGVDGDGLKLPIGYYIFHIQLVQISGAVDTFKIPVALVRRIE